jgi:hypothetical protein
MFSSGFAVTISQSASLPEDDPDTFSLFLEWVYGGRFAQLVYSVQDGGGPFFHRVKLYVVAEKLCLGELADYTMMNLMSNLQQFKICPNVMLMKVAYTGTAAGSTIRNFMCSYLHYLMKTKHEYWWVQIIRDTLAGIPELLYDFIQLVRENEGNSKLVDLVEMPKCTFHKHSKGADCAYKGKLL